MKNAPNAREPYKDGEIGLILTLGMFPEMRKRLARLMGRSPGAIQQAYRWGVTSKKKMKEFHNGGKLSIYHQQILRVRKALGISHHF